MTTRTSITAFVTTGLFALATAAEAAPAGSAAQLCAAAKHKAAFQQAAAKSKCYQKFFRDNLDHVDPECIAKADAKFEKAIAKADAKGGCILTGDAAVIGAEVSSCLLDVTALTPAAEDVCTIPSSCTASTLCLGLVDNSGDGTFGLRMSQLDVSAPAVLASGVVGTSIAGAVLPPYPSCNVFGGGSFNWLLQLDTVANTLTTGGAQPVVDPGNGYSFQNEVISGLTIAPVTTPLGLAGDSFSSTAANVTLPVYSGNSLWFALPLRNLRVTGDVSADQNCIGSYNLTGLDPDNNCQGDGTNPTFLDGGTVHAAIGLEDADAITIPSLAMSLCVLLTGSSDGVGPVQHCARSMGALVAPGNWCSTTDSAGGCADSLEFSGSYAASAILIH